MSQNFQPGDRVLVVKGSYVGLITTVVAVRHDVKARNLVTGRPVSAPIAYELDGVRPVKGCPVIFSPKILEPYQGYPDWQAMAAVTDPAVFVREVLELRGHRHER